METRVNNPRIFLQITKFSPKAPTWMFEIEMVMRCESIADHEFCFPMRIGSNSLEVMLGRRRFTLLCPGGQVYGGGIDVVLG